MRRLPLHWEGIVCVSGASVVLGGFLSTVVDSNPAVRRPELRCMDAAITQFMVRFHSSIFLIGVAIALLMLLISWVAFRSTHDEVVLLRRSLRLTLQGFALLLVAVIGVFVGLFVIPAARCVA